MQEQFHSPGSERELSRFETLGQQLNSIAGQINLSEVCADPARAEIERQFYERGESEVPVFHYPDTGALVTSLNSDLTRLSLPRGPGVLRDLYVEKISDTSLKVRALEAVGNRTELSAITSLLYGRPDQNTVQAALDILAEPIVPAVGAGRFSRDSLREAYELALQAEELHDWQAILGSAPQSYVEPENRIVAVGNRVAFTAEEIERLVSHEVKAHVFRAANGYRAHASVAPLLGTGLDGYDATEEGVAVYAEEASGLLSQPVMRTYAARALAVQSVLEGADFVETYHMLRNNSVSKHGAFKNALRAHRGGAMIRDHIYLEGYLKVKRFAEQGGDMRELYIGKIGLHHLSQMQLLRSEGFLPDEVRHFPEMFDDTDRQADGGSVR